MAFRSGNAVDVFALLDEIRLFARDDLGWTVNRWANGDELSLEHSTGHWHIRAANDVGNLDTVSVKFSAPGIAARSSVDFDSNADWLSHPGDMGSSSAVLGCLHKGDGSAAYWLFGESDYVHVVIRFGPDRYSHLHMGILSKLGSWTGGAYVCGTSAENPDESFNDEVVSWTQQDHGATTIRADIDGLTDAWQSGDGAAGREIGRGLDDNQFQSLLLPILQSAPSVWDVRSPLFPCYVLLRRDNNRFSIGGSPKGMRTLNARFIAAEQTLVVGSDTWHVFPFHEQSGNFAFAYKDV